MSETPEQRMIDWEKALATVPGATALERRMDGAWMGAPALDVRAMVALMRRLEARLATITGVASASGETDVIYHFCLGRLPVNVKTRTRTHALPSIVQVFQAAEWSEREIHDLYGVEFVDHPNLERLIRPPALPPGFFRGRGGGESRGEEQATVPLG